ncbi:hypothetical protein IGL98_000050 [Enterococcus sp. DIV0840]|uniref:DUF5105 domain-containing protein n=1 Tax=Enterococcus TaxID=1350 RepID=UPI001A905A1F|nr:MULTISPECIES: DUF5105 domain-containing protein [Enterococcus]MBO0434337.1 DUF5105 domain-containing protein [Enterococcus sp. DIV0849a]MBO0474134.1 DUF5105 domain-containing protein [Enterococcus ureasiticus]
MKKFGLVFLSVVAIISLAACGGTGSSSKSGDDNKTAKKVSKSKIASISIDEGEYVVPKKEDADEGEGFLALKVTIKNETDKSLDMSATDIMLYDEEDSKIEALSLYLDDSKTPLLAYEKISGKKSKTGYIVFPVEKKAEYKLHFEPRIYDGEKEPKPIILDVDTSEYKDHSDDAIKAATAFVDEVFLTTENKEYNKLVANDRDEAVKNFDENFSKALKKQFYDYKVTDEEGLALAKVFREDNAKVATVDYEIASYFPDVAEVTVKVEGLSFKEMKDDMEVANKEYSEAHRDQEFDERSKAAQKAELDKLPEILKNSKPVSIDDYDDYKIIMKKKDDKWEIQTKGSINYFDSLEQAFRGNMYK